MLLIKTFPGSTASQHQPQQVLVNPLGWSTLMSGCVHVHRPLCSAVGRPARRLRLTLRNAVVLLSIASIKTRAAGKSMLTL